MFKKLVRSIVNNGIELVVGHVSIKAIKRLLNTYLTDPIHDISSIKKDGIEIYDLFQE